MTTTHISSRMKTCAALTNKNIARFNNLTAVTLDA